jgi:hypothetical protein
MTKTSISLSGDCWNGVNMDQWVIENPSIGDLERCLRRLDAEVYTILTIEGSGDAYLMFGGGAGQYIVCATWNREEFWSLINPDAETGTFLINAGGQQGDYRKREVVEFDTALAAGLSFFDGVLLNPKLHWERR